MSHSESRTIHGGVVRALRGRPLDVSDPVDAAPYEPPRDRLHALGAATTGGAA